MDVDYINEVLRIPQKLSVLDAKLVLSEAYDKTYGICNHDNLSADDAPLSIVAYHQAEETFDFSTTKQYITAYRKKRLYRLFGVSLNEFMQLPSEIADELLRQATEEIKQQNQSLEELGDELDL